MAFFNKLFGFSNQRQPASGFQSQSKKSPSQETFILEPILTPSGLVDAGDDSPDAIIIELPDDIETEPDLEVETLSEDNFTPDEVSNLDEVDEVEIPFITDHEELDIDENDIENNSETSEDNLVESNEETVSESSSELTDDSETDITDSASNSESSVNKDLEVDSESLSEDEETTSLSEENVSETESDSETDITDSASNSESSVNKDLEVDSESLSEDEETTSLSEETLIEETISETESDSETEITDSTVQEESSTEDSEITSDDSLNESTEETEESDPTDISNQNKTKADSDNEIDIVEEIASSPINFNSGIFTVGETGEVQVDYSFDGGKYGQGELAIFSLEGMEELDPNSEEFIQEAARRALSDSELGHVVISDANEGARFSGELGEEDFNQGEYLGVKTFNMNPGDEFAVMLIPNGKVEDIFNNPNLEGRNQPLFSLSTANPDDRFQLGQIADVTGDGNTFVFEDVPVDESDRDYNDIIFQVRGATGEAVDLDEVISDKKDWRSDDMGQALIEYEIPYITPEDPIAKVENGLSDLLTELEDLVEEEDSKTEIEGDEEVSETDITETEVVDEIAEISNGESQDESTESKIEETEVIEIEDSEDTPIVEETTDSELEDSVVEEDLPTAVVEETEESEVIEITDYSETPTIEETEELVIIATEESSENSTSQTEPIVINKISENITVEKIDNSEVIEIVDNSQKSVIEETKELEVIENTDNSENLIVEETESDSETLIAIESQLELEETESQDASLTSSVEEIEQSENTKFEDNSELSESNVEETDETESIAIDNNSETPVLAIDTIELEEIENNNSEIPPTPTVESPTVNLVERLENLTYNLQNQTLSETPVNSNLVQQLEQLTNRLTSQVEISLDYEIPSGTLELIEQLETQLVTSPILPTTVEAPVDFEFPTENQPLIGVIDTGFSGENPDIDYSRISWGSDHVDGDSDPTLLAGEGNEHGTHILGLIAAEKDNGIGINGVNNNAPIWAGRAIGSGKWAESLVEFVDAAVESGQPNAVVNLSLDLTQTDAEGNITTRYEFTPIERAAIEYARQNNILIAAAAGNDGGVMSVLGQSSQEFDNIITVGAAEQFDPDTSVWKGADRTNYSSYGYGLDITAYGGTIERPELSLTGDGIGTMSGTSVATAKVTGALSQVWAANPELSYRQVIEIVKNTATDLGETGFDQETGAGLLNVAAAVHLAKVTTPEEHSILTTLIPKTWGGEGRLTPGDRAVAERFWKNGKYYDWVLYQIQRGDTLSVIALETIGGATPDYYNWIAQHNGISNPNYILEGEWIEIPKLAPTPTPPTQPQPTPTPTPQPPAALDPIAEEAIKKAYQQQKTELGQPTSEPVDLGNGFLKQNFEGGYIVWNGNQAITYIAGSTTLITSKDEWTVKYWNNTNLSGTPVWTTKEPPGEIRFNAGLGAPAGTRRVNKDNFSARWETTNHFEGGFYNFISEADDGVRVYIDGVKVIDKWKAAEPWSRRDAYIAIPEGDHKIVVDYFEKGGIAGQTFKWEPSGLLNDWTGDFRPVGYDGRSVHSTYVNTYRRNGAIPKLGYPINNVHVWEGGHTQDFKGGSQGRGAIMKSNANDNSYWVGGQIWTKLMELGGAKYVGYPKTDAIPVPGGLDNSGGKVQHFRGAEGIPSKIWLSKHGAHPTWGAIGGRYEEMGGPSSWLGFPTSKEQGIGNRWVRQDFEGGYMLWHPQHGAIAYDTQAINKLPPDSGNSSTSNWHAQYWDNKELTGSPDWSQYEEMSDLRFHAGKGAPLGTRGIEEETFGGRWITTSYFDGGIYNFINKADDGVRVYVDGKLIIDKWKDSPFEEKKAYAAIEPGYHQVMVEYYDNRHDAANHLRWEQPNTPDEWAVEYFRGKDLKPKNLAGHRGGGTGFIDKNWGRGREAGIPISSDNFSDRWTTTRYFEEPGVYEFDSKSDDGIRVWVDDKLVIDKWKDQGFATNKALVSLDKGYHQIRVEHYENKLSSALKFDWKKVAGEPISTYRTFDDSSDTIDDKISGWLEPWTVEYFNNSNLQGAPVLTRTETPKRYVESGWGWRFGIPILNKGFDSDWGTGRPDASVNSDKFSSRMTTHRYLKGGTYKFNLKGDDGVRLYINGEKVIDRWENPPFRTPHEEEIVLPEGLHRIEVEHSEEYGGAYAGLDWDYLSDAVAHSPAPELKAVYAELENQFGQGAVGVPISDLQRKYYSPHIPFGSYRPMWMKPASYQEFRGTRGRGAIFTDGGHYVSGKLWEAYQNGGGVAQFGPPVASEKDLGNGAYELELAKGILFWAPGMTNPTYYEYAKANPKTLTIPADAWRGEYFDNRNWAGDPLVVRQDSSSGRNLDKFWRSSQSPAPGMPKDNFSVRWTTNRPFDRGTYRFKANHDDGFVVSVNGQKPINKMKEVATQTTGYATFKQGGQYPIEVKHREYGGAVRANLGMEKASKYVVGLDANNNLSRELPGAFQKHGGYDRVGLPINDVHPWHHGYVQDFNHGKNGRGILMRRHHTKTFYYVHGKIWDTYLKQGGPTKLGYPTGDRFNDGHGNTAQEFEHHRITRRPNGETFLGGYVNGHLVPGDFYRVRKKYNMGTPTSGVQTHSSGAKFQMFNKPGLGTSSIVSSSHGTFPLYGGIRTYYVNTARGLNGPLGAPKSAEYHWNGYTRQDFADGYILWRAGQSAVGYRPDGSRLYSRSSGSGNGGGSGSSGGPITTKAEYLKRLYGHGQGNINRGVVGDHVAIDSTNYGPYPYKVYALAGGKVIRKQIDQNGGLYIDIWNEQLQKTFRYLHFESFNPNLDVGEYVNAGDFIGVEGNTGYSTGRHTHFAVVSNGVEINPWPTLASIPGGSGNSDNGNSGDDNSSSDNQNKNETESDHYLVLAGIKKLHEDKKKYNGNYPSDYYDEICRHLFSIALKHQNNKKRAFNELKKLSDGDFGWDFQDEYTELVGTDTKNGWDKVRHFSHSACYRYVMGPLVAAFLTRGKEARDQLEHIIGLDPEGWSNNDMIANYKGITFAKEQDNDSDFIDENLNKFLYIVRKYGWEGVDAVVNFGEEALDIIYRFGGEALEIINTVRKFGSDMVQKCLSAIKLFGDVAISVIKGAMKLGRKTLELALRSL
ncbi:MAG: PA14 domain-containing protein [Microcoleaceae cyanobacterium]